MPVNISHSEIGELAHQAQSMGIFAIGEYPAKPTKSVLSKPQAWHIIAAQRAVYIIKGGKPPLYLISPFWARFSCGLMISRPSV